jgi:hypothetical protein
MAVYVGAGAAEFPDERQVEYVLQDGSSLSPPILLFSRFYFKEKRAINRDKTAAGGIENRKWGRGGG